MDWKKVLYIVGLLAMGVGISFSYGFYLTPKGKQEQGTLIAVLATAVITGLVGFIFAYVGLKGNATVQLEFFIPIVTLILLPTCIISATVAANQLYGLRETVATKLSA